MSKKRKIIYILIGLIILGIVIFMLCSHFTKTKKKEEFTGFTFKEVTELNYGVISLSDFLEEVTCEEKCFYNQEELSYSITPVENLGKNNITISVTYQGKTYEKTYELEIIDEIAPVIELSAEEIEITQNEEVNAKSYIVSLTDNYDELKIEDIAIENKVDSKKVGDYEIIYTIEDENKNQGTSTLIVHVVPKESKENTEEEEKETTTTTDKTSNKNNTTSNSNKENSTTTTTSNFKSAINSVSLSPLKTRYPALDDEISKIISSTTNSGMSNYELLQAIYNYVKNKLSYGQVAVYINDIYGLQDTYSYYTFDTYQIIRAYYSLASGVGVCDNYAALFMILARRLGFDAYVVGGKVDKVEGGTTGHAWVMIKAGGTYYIFDPQIEDSKKTSYDYFGKTDEELPIYHYTLQTNLNKFQFFKEDASLEHSFTLNINVSGSTTDNDALNSGSSRSHQFSTEKGSNVSIEIEASRKQNYTLKLTSNDSVILEESYDGSKKTLNYTFNTLGEDNLKLEVNVNNRYKVEYTLKARVKDAEA